MLSKRKKGNITKVLLGTVFALFLLIGFSCNLEQTAVMGTVTDQETRAINSNSPAFPFPQQVNFPGTIKPNHRTQEQLNQDVLDFYNYWEGKYVKTSNGNTPGGGYYIKADSTGGHPYPIKSNSEAHGYGMLIYALMGDKVHYDGMWNMFNEHRSVIDSDLMSWVITEDEIASQDGDSATDGDFDVAYSMILADKQWGSNGAINYLAEAKRMITNGIKQSDMGSSTYRTMLGDWDTDQNSTRSSDWMSGHMRVFADVTNDSFWISGANTVYSLISSITNNYSSNTGLMPDFIVNSNPTPAPGGFLEGPNDGSYFYNACRYPWRITVDYAHFGTPAAKTAMDKVVNWLKTKTNNNPGAIESGFLLNGNTISGSNYFTGAFAAPFITATIVDSSNQSYLNAGWDAIRNNKETYYEDNVTLLCMLMISGNWWNPLDSSTPDSEAPSIPAGLNVSNLGSTSLTLNWNASTDNIGVTGYNVYQDGSSIGNSTGTSLIITGLTAETTYGFRVSAYDAAGNTSNQSSELSVTTKSGGSDPDLISLNKSVTVSSIESSEYAGSNAVDGDTSSRWASLEGNDNEWIFIDLGSSYDISRVVLNWEAAYATNYKIELSNNASNWTNASVLKNVTNGNGGLDDYSVSGSGRFIRMNATARGTAYGYSLFEYEVYGNSGVTDTEAPTIPNGLSSSNITQTSCTLSWNISTDNVGVTGYNVYRDGNLIGNTAGTSSNITGLTANTTYSLRVSAYDAAGNTSNQSSPLSVTTDAVPVDTQKPTIPNGLSSSNITQTSCTLSWNTSTDNVGVTGYNVYRDGSLIGNTAGTSLNITGLTEETTYSFSVSAYDAAGNTSNQSSALLVTTDSGSTTPALISLNKSVTTLSIEGNSFTGDKAVDGDTNSRWASLEGVDPQWIYIDLGAVYDITQVKLIWETAYGKAYTIAVSNNGTNWTTVKNETNSNGGTDDISLSANGRYVRMYGTARGTEWGYSLFEFEVYGY